MGELVTNFLLGNFAGNVWYQPSDWGSFTRANFTRWPEGEEYRGFGSRRGRNTWCSALGAYVMPTYHTAAVLRGGPYFISDIARDLSKISTVINEFAPDGHEADYKYTVVTSIEEGQSVLDNLPKADVALDIETNYGGEDIDVFTEDLLCLSITWGWNDTSVIPGEIAKKLDWSVTEGVRWVGQNFGFDSNGIKRWVGKDVDLPISEDTMLQSYALDERPGRHRLEVLGGEWCAAPFWKSELQKYRTTKVVEIPLDNGKVRRLRKSVKDVPPDALYKYNAGDTTYTYRTHVRQRPRITSDNMERVYSELLVPSSNAFKDIQQRGIFIDQHRQSELMVDWCELWLEQEEELQQIARDAGWDGAELNFRSFPQMKQFLYETLGLPIQYTKDTKRGEPPKITTDKNALEALYSYHPFCHKAHDWRQTAHMIGVSEGIRQRIKFDGMLHATPQPTGTETGRLSYRDPNLQNIAQDWMVGPNLARIRQVFAPVNPETHFIMEADYKQIELWMAMHWSQDPNMRDDLETGDFHRMTAMDINNKTWDEVTKGDRFWAKAVTFGKLYDRSAADLIRGPSSLKVSLAEAYSWVKRWEQRYSGYMHWSANKKEEAIEDGILVTPWGRKRRYYLVMGEEAHHQLRSAVNFCMQSTAHDYTLTALIELQKVLYQYDSYILIESHDALLLEVSRKYAKEVHELVYEVMTNVRPNSEWPKLMVEFKSGPNWGACKEECGTCKRMYPEVNIKEVQLTETVSALRCEEHAATPVLSSH
jgi:DNA polymerase-1